MKGSPDANHFIVSRSFGEHNSHDNLPPLHGVLVLSLFTALGRVSRVFTVL